MFSAPSRSLVPILLICLGGTAFLPGVAVGAPGPAGALPGAATPAEPRVTDIAAGSVHSLVVATDGRVYGTGSNLLGQLTGSQRVERGLALLTGLPAGVGATAVAGGYADSLVVGDDGVAYGTGLNENGQLTGSKARWHRLHPLSGLPDGVRAVGAASGSYHNLVLGDDGLAYGAGDNWSGQLTGPPRNKVRTLVPLVGLPVGVAATQVAAGRAFSLVLGDDGVVYGAGDNSAGQLTGTADDLRTLTPLAGLPAGVSATAVDAAARQSLVLGSDGRAYGAGHNQVGQLTGVDDPRQSLAPLAGLPAGVRALGVAAGDRHSLVLGDDGVAYGTGSNVYGQLTRSREFRLVLTPLQPIRTGAVPVGIAAGWRHSLVLGDDGRAYGVGANGAGQISGDGNGWRTLVRMEWGFANLVRPVLIGTPRVGMRLTVRPGRWWPAAASYRFQWYRDGLPVSGATTRSRVVTSLDLGSRLKAKVIAERPGIRTGSGFTRPVGPVRP